MSQAQILDQLALSQNLVTALVEDVDDAVCRTQYSTELSPLGWHLGHCVYVECHWLHEVVRGDASVTAPLRSFYQPPCTPKAERGRQLPQHAVLLAWAQDLQAYNLRHLANLNPALARFCRQPADQTGCPQTGETEGAGRPLSHRRQDTRGL
jgi:iron(II)-dependent oxidoreductase